MNTSELSCEHVDTKGTTPDTRNVCNSRRNPVSAFALMMDADASEGHVVKAASFPVFGVDVHSMVVLMVILVIHLLAFYAPTSGYVGVS